MEQGAAGMGEDSVELGRKLRAFADLRRNRLLVGPLEDVGGSYGLGHLQITFRGQGITFRNAASASALVG